MTAPNVSSPADPVVVSLWFVSVPNAAAVLSAEPSPDRGFGRKYLSQLDSSKPITAIGTFPLNRSTVPGHNEFYIGGFPGVIVVQTLVDTLTKLSELPRTLMLSVDAPDLYVFAEGQGESTFAGIAHFQGDKLRRSFCATRSRVYEDKGLPEPFEYSFWSGDSEGIDLPFAPKDLVAGAEVGWLGVPITADGPDINVVGFATDGRKEPRIESHATPTPLDELVVTSSTKLGFSATNPDYDDYEGDSEDGTDDDTPGAELAQVAKDVARIGWLTSKKLARYASSRLSEAKERLRHLDRKEK